MTFKRKGDKVLVVTKALGFVLRESFSVTISLELLRLTKIYYRTCDIRMLKCLTEIPKWLTFPFTEVPTSYLKFYKGVCLGPQV